ncbi:hypothetical protein BJP36_36750 [Moorena producens JHB]|uniref:Uncharacterized protein n=1 Tax=Moorena producens (strain JHB) TaxID=1454205 RepID=A0A9Q9SU21_MOOP1|nr:MULTISPECIES: hypothetical protein [Moorena]WAN69645.1 hypothetical protein BJP36_36750 [Moorena producens JHB]
MIPNPGIIKADLPHRKIPDVATTVTLKNTLSPRKIWYESPEKSEIPLSHWTPRELAAEALKRVIVEKIYPAPYKLAICKI